jgi:PHD/YefM family antitoxin component YafN of YafNO toxin-antitoxin module
MLRIPTVDTREIHPLTDFLRNAKAHIAHLKKTGSPEVLTVNGRAEIVVLDAASYQRMQELLERAELVLSLRGAVTEMDEGKGIPLENLEAELTARFGAQ